MASSKNYPLATIDCSEQGTTCSKEHVNYISFHITHIIETVTKRVGEFEPWKCCTASDCVLQIFNTNYHYWTAENWVVREDGSDLPFLRCSGFGWYKLSGPFHYLLLSVKTDEQILPTWLFCRALRGSVTTGSCVTVENMPAHRALSLVLFFSTYPHTEHTVPGISRHGYLFSSSIYSFLAKPCYNQRSTIALSTENPRPWRRWHVGKRNSSPLETQGTRHHHSASRNVVLGLRSKNQAMGELCTVRPGGLWRLRW